MSILEERLFQDQRQLRDKVAAQAEAVEQAVGNAIHSLQTGNKKLAYATILNDYPINRTMREIDRLCHRFIAVHLPSSTYLRLISSVIRVNIELERIGDYAVIIAREGVQMSSPPADVLGRELERMTADTMTMVKQTIKAFNDLNAELAKGTKHLSDNVEYNLDAVYAEITEKSELQGVKDSLALFVVFNQLKRVVDQCRNICEDTVFAVTGMQKKPKVYNILFLDEDNSLAGQLAEAIGKKNHPNCGVFSSAGRAPASEINPALIEFLSGRGATLEDVEPTAISELSNHDISEQHVVVSLQGGINSYLSEIPFHTNVLEWDVGETSGHLGTQEIESLYRNLALHIKDLMDLMCGAEVED
jgi:phosphate transport system protein